MIPGVQSLLSQAGDSLAAALAPAVARQVALAVGWLLLFAAGFIVFKLVCRLLIWLLDLLDEVPGLHFLNHLGGAALGVLKGGLLIAVVVSILLWCDVLPRSMVDATLLLRWLASSAQFTKKFSFKHDLFIFFCNNIYCNMLFFPEGSLPLCSQHSALNARKIWPSSLSAGSKTA